MTASQLDVVAPSPNLGTYPDPLALFLDRPALSTATLRLPNNKRFYAPIVATTTSAMSRFPAPVLNAPNDATSPVSGFDAHICYDPEDALSRSFAQRLHSAVRHTFPHVRVYELLDGPAGPHSVATFEIALFTPEEFGDVVPWLMIWRGPLSVLVHANTTVGHDEVDGEGGERGVRDHVDRAMWLGEKMSLRLEMLRSGGRQRKEKQ